MCIVVVHHAYLVLSYRRFVLTLEVADIFCCRCFEKYSTENVGSGSLRFTEQKNAQFMSTKFCPEKPARVVFLQQQ